MSLITGIVPAVVGQTASATDYNANFSRIVDEYNTHGVKTDTAATLSATLTFAVAPVFLTAITMDARLTITAGGAGITGDVSVNGNVGVGGTVTAGVVVTSSNIVSGGLLQSATTLTVGTSAAIGTSLSAAGNITTSAGQFVGSGAGLTAIPAASLTGTLPALSGVNLTALNASNLTSGTVNQSLLPYALGTRSIQHLDLVNGGTLGGLSFGSDYYASAGTDTVPALTSKAPVAGLTTVEWVKIYLAGSVTPRWIACYS